MSTAILKFKMPEEQEEFKYALCGIQYAIALENVDNYLRDKAKYEDQETVSIEELREFIRQELDGLDL